MYQEMLIIPTKTEIKKWYTEICKIINYGKMIWFGCKSNLISRNNWQ